MIARFRANVYNGDGALAQLGERCFCKAEVAGSNPASSKEIKMTCLYDPQSELTQQLCAELGTRLPDVDFQFRAEDKGLRVIGRFRGRYCELLLREQQPTDAADWFIDRLLTKHNS